MIGRRYLKQIQKNVRAQWRKNKRLCIIGFSSAMFVFVLVIVASATTYKIVQRRAVSTKIDTQDHKTAKYEAIPPGQLKHLEKMESGECKGLYRIVLPEKSRAKYKDTYCTHGPDLARSVGDGGADVSGSYATQCYGDGVSGKRVQAIYAVASDKPDRYNQFLSSIRNWAGYIDAQVEKSAQKTGGHLRVKWVTDGGCQVQVAKVIMPPDGDDSAGHTVAALKDAGFNGTDRKYLTWVDDSLYCGIATLRGDDRRDPLVNANDVGYSYSRIDTPCWGKSESTELHELFHNLGAVQDSAPHSTGHGHCTDEYDLLCYNDSIGTTLRYVCPVGHEALLDCNNDDYFHSHPPDGSYLATHWNTFNSSFLFSRIPTNTVSPTSPSDLVATATSRGVQLSWTASTDDEGKAITYKIFRAVGSGWEDSIGTATKTTYLDSAVLAGKSYKYYVVAYDPDGNASTKSNIVNISLPLVPTTPLPQPDTTPPPAVTNLSASNIGMHGFTLSWNLPAVTSDIKSIVVLINGSAVVTTSSSATSHNHCCSLSPDTSYIVQIKTLDAAGNYAFSNQITVKTLPVAVTPGSNIPYNLSLVKVDGAETTISARVDAISDPYFYRLVAIGESAAISIYLSPKTSPSTANFIMPRVRPQNVTGYYIAVFTSSYQEVGRSATMPFSYSGSPESNPPTTPANLRISSTTGAGTDFTWDIASDDSGKIYIYHPAIKDNTTNTTTELAGAYLPLTNRYSLQSGHSYTLTVTAEDIWGNISAAGSYSFSYP